MLLPNDKSIERDEQHLGARNPSAEFFHEPLLAIASTLLQPQRASPVQGSAISLHKSLRDWTVGEKRILLHHNKTRIRAVVTRMASCSGNLAKYGS